MLKTNPVKFAKSLYYANTTKIPHKIQPRPFKDDVFMPASQKHIKTNFCKKVGNFFRTLFK